MSKSLGNFYTLRDLLEMGYQPEAIRYLLASVPYRKKLNFTFEGLKAATKSIERLRDFELRLTTTKFPAGSNPELAGRSRAAIEQFEAGMDDDLNTAEALAAIYEYVRAMNTAIDENQFREDNRWDCARVLEVFDCVFDVLKPSERGGAAAEATGDDVKPSPGQISEPDIEQRIEERTAAKKARDFQRADAIRRDLLEHGIVLEDTKDGVRWKRK
jgi:cysteinyl-tRNA synthetase